MKARDRREDNVSGIRLSLIEERAPSEGVDADMTKPADRRALEELLDEAPRWLAMMSNAYAAPDLRGACGHVSDALITTHD
jgi:hypothetical protein